MTAALFTQFPTAPVTTTALGNRYKSVLKNLTTAADEVTSAAAAGDFDNTPYIGTLENDGVGIAPTHDWESKLDPALLEEVEQLKADIISGAFTVDSPSSPKN